MSDPVIDPSSVSAPHCPWCSAILPAATVEKCPSCGAALASSGSAEPVLPGVTTIDPEAILRARSESPRARNRLISFLSGEVPTADTPGSAGSLEPPPAAVRREMLRLELEAEKSRLEAERSANQAEVVSLAADQIASGKLVIPEAAGLLGGSAAQAVDPVSPAPIVPSGPTDPPPGS